MGIATLEAKRRQRCGTAAARALRHQGLIPAILYGHGQEALPLAVSREALLEAIGSGAHMLALKVDGQEEQVLIRDIQYDTFGDELIHVDFARVASDELISIEVPLELHGTAKGVLGGGVLNQPLHRLAIQCLAGNIPDVIRVEISNLDINDAVHVRDLVLPPGVKTNVPPDTVVVMVHPPKAEEVVTAAPAEEAAAEPELIRGRPTEEAEEAEETPRMDEKQPKSEKA